MNNEHNKTIGIIGSGMIGANVARLATAAGLKIVICNSRGPETLAELVAELGPNARAATLPEVAAATDLIVLAVPFSSYAGLPADTLAGKIVIDTMNYYPERDGAMLEVQTDTIATSELVQRHLKDSRVVRALSNMDFVRLRTCARPGSTVDRSAVPIAGDDAAAKAEVIAFLDQIGYDAVDMGPLSESWRSEPTMPAYVLPYMSPEASIIRPVARSLFLSSPGRVVSRSELEELVGLAVRHDKMFGALPVFSPTRPEMSTDTQKQKIRVGIVGMRPRESWAAIAHLPALRQLGDDFEVVGVANLTLESALAATEAHDIPQAFASVSEMAASPEIDLVVVTTRVPQHAEAVKAALAAGKHVYCEWPLGRTLAESVELADLARAKGCLTVTGTQARVSPAIRQLQRLVADDHIGQIASTNIIGYVETWGPTITDVAAERYLRERRNGANLLTIPFGHMMAALRDVLGEIAEVSSQLTTCYPQVQVVGTDDCIPTDAPDHIVVAGRLANGAPLAITYIGGTPPGDEGFIWDIRGERGDLRITGPHGYAQIAPFRIWERLGPDTRLREISPAPDPLQALGLVPGNVARIYQRFASDLRHGTRTAPSFEDAVALHRVLHAIEQSAETGNRTILQPAPPPPTQSGRVEK